MGTDGCTSGRNASSGKPAAYQVRCHRTRRRSAWTVCSRLSSELYAMCSRSVTGPMQPHPCQGYAVTMGTDGCTSGRNASSGELSTYQARWYACGPAWTVSGRLTSELYAIHLLMRYLVYTG